MIDYHAYLLFILTLIGACYEDVRGKEGENGGDKEDTLTHCFVMEVRTSSAAV